MRPYGRHACWKTLLGVLLGGLASYALALQAGYHAWIDVEASDGSICVLAMGQAGDEVRAPLWYEMTVRREGPSGTLDSRQGGRMEAAGGRVDTLSRVRVNVGPGDRLRAVLVVREEGRVIAADSLDRRW